MHFVDDNTIFCVKSRKIWKKFMSDRKFPVYFYNIWTPKNVRRMIFNRIMVLAMFELLQIVLGCWE